MKAGAYALPEDHEGCGDSPCLACKATAGLEPEDWTVVNFYQVVSDQVENPAPFGLEGGKVWIPLKLSEMVAACDLLEIPAGERLPLISDTRYLHDLVTGRVKEKGVHRLPAAALAPPEAD